MNLRSDEIAGLASASPKFRNLLKTAANGLSFNENVPGAQGGTASDPSQGGGTGYGPNSAPAGVIPPTGQEPSPEEEYAAVPQEGAMPPEQAGPETPEAVGARAAQAFLGPVMEAAMSGDPGAQDLVARAAGSVAGSVAESYSRSMNNGQGAPAGAPAAPAVPTPEEDLANQIVQPPAPKAPPGQNGENGEEEELDENGQPKKKKKPPFPPKK